MPTAAPAKIPFVDLQAQYRSLKADIDATVLKTMEETAFIQGERVRRLENDFAAYSGARYGIGASSGTSALHAALVAAGIGEGDEVITVAHTFIATVESILHAGAVPVFVDIDPETYCLDPARIEAAITPRTKAIVPVHLYGQLADMEAILAVAKKHDLIVIEDAAQAHGAANADGKRAGSMGLSAAFSFYPGKNLGAYGDAGIITTNDEALSQKLHSLMDHGRETKYTHQMIGYNYRLDGLQAAILSVKLKRLDDWNRARRRAAHRYNALLKGLEVVTPVESRGHVYHLYILQVNDRDGLGKALEADGIATGVHYPVPLHLQPCLKDHPSSKAARLPVTERVASRIISLPMFAEITEEQQERVAAGIRKFVEKR
jgi:dTDP-4-amino-4,6-dideoxygalactose transaminase